MMMTPEIVASVIAVLTPALPYITKAGESLAGEVGKESFKKAAALFTKIKDKFRSSGAPKGETTLDLFADDPDTYEVALMKLLSKLLEENPEFATQLQQDLANEKLQEIIATNESTVTRVRMQLTSGGKQSVRADGKSQVSDIDMSS